MMPDAMKLPSPMDDFVHDGPMSDITRRLGTIEKWIRNHNVEAGSLSGSGAWDPDKPPASAGILDDEFNDNALSAGWTEYDPDAKTTWTEGDGGLLVTVLTTATDDLNGLYKDVQVGDFTVWTKIGITARELNIFSPYICFWENPAGNNKQFVFAFQRDSTANYVARIGVYEFSNRTTVSSTKLATVTIGYTNSLYLRVRRNTTNYYFEFSMDGLSWRTPNANAAYTFSFVPTKVGIGVTNNNTGQTANAIFQFFRSIGSDVGFAGIMAGNR